MVTLVICLNLLIYIAFCHAAHKSILSLGSHKLA